MGRTRGVCPQITRKEATPQSYETRLKTLEDKGDWVAVRQLALELKNLSNNPNDNNIADIAEAEAAYKMGEIDEAIKLWQALFNRKTSSQLLIYKRLLALNKIRNNFPDLKLQPLKFEPGEASLESSQWRQKSMMLLAAKQYDDIEQVAATLQKSNDAAVDGTPHLSSFFGGLTATKARDFKAVQTSIIAWRMAKPQSNLARLAEIQMWTDAAWDARGSGMSSTITDAMEARMEVALQKSSQCWANLPKTAFKSPIAFVVALTRAQLMGVPRKSLDDLFISGTTLFPNYQPLYGLRASQLLPRWYGKPGEAEEMLKRRADAIGGTEGDIFYGCILWHLSSYIGDLSSDSKFDYERAKRGLNILSARFPDSNSILSARLGLAFFANDYATFRPILASSTLQKLDSSWWIWKQPKSQNSFLDYRMGVLGDPLDW